MDHATGQGSATAEAHRAGNDVAGIVIAAGPASGAGADPLAAMIGTRVFGTAVGAFADEAITRPEHVAPAPTSISSIEAAALPIAGLTA